MKDVINVITKIIIQITKRDNIVFLNFGISQASVVFFLNIFVIREISFNNVFCRKKKVKKEDNLRDLVIENGKQYLNSLQKEINTLEALEKINDDESNIILKSIRNLYDTRKKLLEKKDN